MDVSKKFGEILLPEKKDYYNHLNMKCITDADYAHAKRVCKDFEIKNLGKCHDLRVQKNILFLANVFESFIICLLKYLKLVLQNFVQLLD